MDHHLPGGRVGGSTGGVFGNLLKARVWWCRDGNGEGSPPFSEAFSEGSNKKPSTGASGLNRGLGICQAYPH